MAVNSFFIVIRLRLENLSSIVIAALCGIVTADFISGLVHWAADTWGSVELPILGKVSRLNKSIILEAWVLFYFHCFLFFFSFITQNFLRPFREHHIDPTSITRHDFIETNGDNFMVTIPALCKLTWDFLTLPELEIQRRFLWSCYWWQLAIFVAMTNQVKCLLQNITSKKYK